jgi:tartrate dehydratase alpha subunit/fumarate hydratase class I-like protein
VMAVDAGRVFVRPKGGGCEWEAAAGDLCPADSRAELRSRVSELNALSRWAAS